MIMTYEVLDIAKYIVQKSNEDGHPVSNLQLQKILFYIQREFLQRFKIALFWEDFEAWQFGPVVPVIYRRYCGAAALPLTLYDENDFKPIDNHSKFVIDRILREKEALNPWEMVKDLHQPGRAWSIIYMDGIGVYNIIPKDLIRDKG